MCDCDGDDCCKRIAKFLLVVINLLFFLLGLLMLAFGIAMVVAPDKVAIAVKDTGADISVLGNASSVIKGSGIFMIILGGIVTLIGGFGFFGACCENKVLLVLYLIIVILVLLAEVALIIFAACFPDAWKKTIQDEMRTTITTDFRQDINIYPNVTLGCTGSGIGCAWAATQVEARCCGVVDRFDYANATYRWIATGQNTSTYSTVPVSCCALKGSGKVKLSDVKSSDAFVNLQDCISPNPTTPTQSINQKGCYMAIDSMIQQASRIAIGIAAAIVGFQIIIIILGFILCCHLRKYKSAAI